eukprot:2077576-Rhodomonas_salina.1
MCDCKRLLAHDAPSRPPHHSFPLPSSLSLSFSSSLPHCLLSLALCQLGLRLFSLLSVARAPVRSCYQVPSRPICQNRPLYFVDTCKIIAYETGLQNNTLTAGSSIAMRGGGVCRGVSQGDFGVEARKNLVDAGI